MTHDQLNDALTEPRISWERIVDAGYDLQDIADTAGAHGDHKLRRRAVRAARRREACSVLVEVSQ